MEHRKISTYKPKRPILYVLLHPGTVCNKFVKEINNFEYIIWNHPFIYLKETVSSLALAIYGLDVLRCSRHTKHRNAKR